MAALLPGVTAFARHHLLASRSASQAWNTLVLPWAEAGSLPLAPPLAWKVLISLASVAECFNPTV